ncbi:lauroyl acyltransferase, partial [Thioclava sp. BHET1]
RENLRLIVPDMPDAEVKRLCEAVPDNFGRTFIEFFSGADFTRYVAAHHKVSGPGLPAIAQARATGRPVVFVTGHFGNYDASRVALSQVGYQIGALYRPMNNGWFNDHYVNSILKIGKPMFPRGKKGLGE